MKVRIYRRTKLGLVALCVMASLSVHAEFIMRPDGEVIEGTVLRLSGDLMEIERSDGSIERLTKKDVKLIFFGTAAEARAFQQEQDVHEEAAVQTGEPRTLRLSPSWERTPVNVDDPAVEDFEKLVSPYVDPSPRITFHEFPEMAPGIPFMAERRQLEQMHGWRFQTEAIIRCPAFPPSSFKFYKYAGDFEGGYNELLLMTDLADQVVGAQWVNDHPDEFEPLEIDWSDMWEFFNFVQMRKKSGSRAQVGFRVEDHGRVLCIDSGVRQHERERYGGYEYKLREKVRLCVPREILALMRYHIEQQRR